MESFENQSLIMGQRLRELRTARHLSFESLKKALMEKYNISISIDSLKNYEVSQSWHTKAVQKEGMSIKYLRCFADFYGVSADYLLGMDVPQTPDVTIREMIEKTGLSEKAIEHLQHHKSIIDGDQSPLAFENTEQSAIFLQMLSMMISHPNFFHFVCDMSKCGILHNSGTSGVITMDDGQSALAGEVAATLEKQGWSILSNIHVADYWLYSSLETLRGIAKDIWEKPRKYGENLDK